MEQVKANIVETKSIQPNKECLHVVYDKDKTAYCHANVKDKAFRCADGDYTAHSYFPVCKKYTNH